MQSLKTSWYRLPRLCKSSASLGSSLLGPRGGTRGRWPAALSADRMASSLGFGEETGRCDGCRVLSSERQSDDVTEASASPAATGKASNSKLVSNP